MRLAGTMPCAPCLHHVHAVSPSAAPRAPVSPGRSFYTAGADFCSCHQGTHLHVLVWRPGSLGGCRVPWGCNSWRDSFRQASIPRPWRGEGRLNASIPDSCAIYGRLRSKGRSKEQELRGVLELELAFRGILCLSGIGML